MYELYWPQGNDFELISTVKMETRHPAEGSFGSEFKVIYNHYGVMAAWSSKRLKNLPDFLHFFGKNNLKFSKFCSKGFHCDTDQRIVFKCHEILPMENQ